MHAVVYTRNAEADRAFFRDVLGFSSVDAGGGWLIFAAPPSELACHPAESNGKQELYLMCDDLQAEIAHLGEKGIACGPVSDQGWGLLSTVRLPGGAISDFTSRITQQLIGRATEPAAAVRSLHSLSG
jgi:catechol 2,3-dioxygenase-like lactoylglutathione lyase family enzyme